MYAVIKRLDDGATFTGKIAGDFLVNRLSPEVYARIVGQFPHIAVTNDTSAMQAGFQLGVQAVLKRLRDEYVLDAA